MKFIYNRLVVKLISKILLIFFLLSNYSIANEIGVIGFIIGNAFNQDGKKLNVGDPIFYGDTIKTDEGGKSQIMFVDQTVMTIGSNTELVVDEFVYDPDNKDGKLLSTIKSGSVKILTGKISEKNPENLVVDTPAGTIGTRGTEFKAAVDPETLKSQILLIGPGPKNSLGLRPGAVEVANESGSVILDKPYLFTEVSENTAPRQPVIIPQSELKKFQELEIEADEPVTDNDQNEEGETQLAENEEALPEEDEEINEIIKAEIFEEGEELGDLVLETMVTALSKDDGGITAQLLGKSFLNSGQVIPRALIPDDVKAQLPEGIDLNSPEADAFFANELQNEIEKVMLVSARIEDVAFVPTEFNQFNAGLGDIKVPIVNDETGDVVFLNMGDINFQPQFVGLPGDQNSNQPVLPEQLTLRGQEGIAIDLGKGQFFEQQIDPQMEALNERFEEALASGASAQELDQLILEMDQAIFQANEAAQAFEVAALQDQLGSEFEMDIFSNEEFREKIDSFVFNTEDYSNSWIEADNQGLVPVFALDGSVNFLEEEQAIQAQFEIDQVYEQEFAEQFPELYAAQQNAEELSIKANQEAELLYSKIDEAVLAGASEDEINELYEDINSQVDQIYSEVDQAYEMLEFAEYKTDIIEISADQLLLDPYYFANYEDPSMIDYLDARDEVIDEAIEEAAAAPAAVVEESSGAYSIGTTTYSDLNDRSSGIDTYTGEETNLIVTEVAIGSPLEVGAVAGTFIPITTIDYGNRTINQFILGQDILVGNTTYNFSIDKDHIYEASTTGNVTPTFVVQKGASSRRLDDSLTGDVTTTVPASYNDATGNAMVTVTSEFLNQSSDTFADTVDTTLTVQSRPDPEDELNAGVINTVTGTNSSGKDEN